MDNEKKNGTRNGNGRGKSPAMRRKQSQKAALEAVLARTEAALAPSDALMNKEGRNAPAKEDGKGRQGNGSGQKKASSPTSAAEKKSDAKTQNGRRKSNGTKGKDAQKNGTATGEKDGSVAEQKTATKNNEVPQKAQDARKAPPRQEEGKKGNETREDASLRGTPLVIPTAFPMVQAERKKEPSGGAKTETQSKPKERSQSQNAEKANPPGGPVKAKRRRRRSSGKKLYEVDNEMLPDGLPPVDAFPILPLSQELREKGEEEAQKSEKENRQPRGKNENKGKESRGKKPAPAGKKGQAGPSPASTQSVLTGETEVKEAVLSLLESAGTPLSRELLLKDINASPKSMLDGVLLEMLENGEILLSKKRKYALPSQLGYLVGILQVTTRGFGFLISEGDEDDVFVPQKSLNGAMNGDEVVLRLMDSTPGNREGEVIAIRSHANSRIIGVLRKVKGGFVVNSDNMKLSDELRVASGATGGASDGQKVVADIEYHGGEALLHVVEVLGDPDDAEVDILSIIRAHDITQEFPRHVLTAARALPQTLSRDDVMRREDLRHLTLFTIDGADAKDFDDAISCEMLENGNYLLGVHIADVAHYVRENGALDKEALRRGTSVYLVDRVIPMLPEEISNGICSLRPEEDRFALSCLMEIDGKARVVSHRIAETVIRSKARMIYEDVTALLEGDSGQAEQYREFSPTLKNMEKLAALLHERRAKRGSIDFDLPETRITLNEEGHPVKIGRYERGVANKMIEEFMLICNETIAEHMAYLERPMLYRVHEAPDAEKVRELGVFLGGLGYSLRNSPNGIRPKALQSILEKAKGTAEENIVSRVILRSLQKARYADENLGHFGLAAEYYCHFTSPIRRYPDLEVHRIVKELIHGQMTEKRQELLRSKLPDIARQSSERERSAMAAERDVDDLKKAEYLAEHVGEMFDGVVSGVTSFGLFVALPNTCEGMVRISDIGDDYYSYDEKKYRIVGRHSHKVYSLGDPVRIRVQSVDTNARKVDFALIEDKGPRGRRPRKSRK